jgi:N-acetylglucosaminyl-diphospho-decaprenol L-rhamnosyltransferase
MTPSVCTIIVNYRSAELAVRATNAALRATERLSHAPIFLVDNHSDDGSVESLEHARPLHGWPDRVVIRDSGKNGGYGFGNNVGFRLGMMEKPVPDYFYILNPDAFPDDDAVEELIRFGEAHPDVGIIGSAARGLDGAPHCTAFRFPTIASEFEAACRLGVVSRALSEFSVPLGPDVGEGVVDWVGGMSVLLRREVIERVGMFDEKYFLYFEETDLCKRALSAGFKTACAPRSRIVHIGSAVTGLKDMTVPYPTFWYDSRRRYFEKHHGARYLLAADVARLGGELIHRARLAVFPVDRPRKPHFIRDFVRHMVAENWRQLSLASTRRG